MAPRKDILVIDNIVNGVSSPEWRRSIHYLSIAEHQECLSKPEIDVELHGQASVVR